MAKKHINPFFINIIMKKRAVLFILLFSLASMNFISAEHIATFSDGDNSVTVNKSSIEVYNISVSNLIKEEGQNISQVIIKFPYLLKLVENSFDTDAQIDSNGTSSTDLETTIFWSNSTYLINGSEIKNFWFSANATAYANYTLTIISLNSSAMFSSELKVRVLGSQADTCVVNWTCSSFSLCANGNQTRNCTDVNNCNISNGKPPEIQSCQVICSPSWQCTSFSICSNGIQMRSCVDVNNCNDETTKPVESQICENICTPNWNCSEWIPESNKCPKDKTQTRICSDLNNCNNLDGKPPETQTCEYKSRAELVFKIIVVVLIFASLFVLILIIKRKMDESNSKINKLSKKPDSTKKQSYDNLGMT
jgi:hypothetical protein